MHHQCLEYSMHKSIAHTVLDESDEQVHTISAEATVLEAVLRMVSSDIGAFVVTVGATPIGMFSEHDLVKRVLAENRELHKTWVAEVMTVGLTAVEPSTTIEEALSVMSASGYHHLPVIDDNVLVATVSLRALTEWALNYQALYIDDLVRYITGR